MNKISNKQIFYILFMSMATYNVVTIPYITTRVAGRGAWVPIVITTLIFAITSLFITGLNNMYKGKMLVEYSPQIIGKLLSYVISMFYILYFAFIFVFLEVQMTNMINAEFLTKTPKAAIAFAGILVMGYIAYKGISNIGRLLELIVPAFLIFSLVVFIMALFQGTRYNVEPFYEPNRWLEYMKGIPATIVPFLGLELLLFIPFGNNKKPSLLVFFSIVFVGLYYLLVVECSIKIVGINTIIHYRTAVIEALRLIDFPILERVDILYLTIGFCGLFSGGSIVFTAVVEIICKMFEKARRDIVVICVGILLYLVVVVVDLTVRKEHDTLSLIASITGAFSAIILPAILFIIAKVRRNVKKNS